MDNHKLVTISIFGFLNMKKMQFLFFYEKYAWKNFRIWPYATKYFFLFENVLKFFIFEIFQRKPGILIPYLYFTL